MELIQRVHNHHCYHLYFSKKYCYHYEKNTKLIVNYELSQII